MKRFLSKYWVLLLLLAAAPGWAMDSSIGTLTVTKEVSGLKKPWAFGFLPSGDVLITEKRGRLLLAAADGTKQSIAGVPKVVDKGQGGLLDVLVSRDFETSGLIFLTYVTAQAQGTGTAVLAAKLDITARKLTQSKVIFQMTPGSQGDRHFGSRLAQAPDGTLYVTLGDRGDRPSAQDLSRHNGSIVRISPDGQRVSGNPFTDKGNAEPEIWSYGHRNPQGIAISSSGKLWAVEHGARGGDEVNLIRKGANYGWPVIAYGRHYSGQKIGEGVEKSGMQQPKHYWDPSIAPSGLMIYEGSLFSDWNNDIFIGSLKFDYISRLSGANLTEVESLKSAETKRVRDVRQAPDGSIWFLSEDRGALYRITP